MRGHSVCPPLPSQAQGNPPCIPEWEFAGLVLGLVALVVAARRRGNL